MLGNHPAVDLMVISPSGQSFSVDVKGFARATVGSRVGKSRARNPSRQPNAESRTSAKPCRHDG